MLDYLLDRWQRIKVNATFSSWSELLKGVPQGSVLGPLLFNIYLNDLFFVLNCKACNFADDTTPFVSDMSLEVVLEEIEDNTKICVDWFENNYMKMNPDKSHILVSGNKSEHIGQKLVRI